MAIQMSDFDAKRKIDLRAILKHSATEKEEASAMTGPQKIHIDSSTEELVISTDDVEIDERYQKSFSTQWAREIARNFDPQEFGKPQVARRPNGKFAVIDGQHRIGALRFLWPNQSVTFTADLVRAAEGVKSEARYFLAHNAHAKKADTGTILKALLAAEDESALSYQRIVEGAGYRMKSGGGRARPGELHAYVFTLIRRLGGIGWEVRLTNTLKVAKGAWGLSQFPLVSPVVAGIASFLDRHGSLPQFSMVRLQQVLQHTTPMALEAEGRSFSALSRISTEGGVREVIRRQYNSRLADKNQLPEL